jgi:hypothetical protein
VATLKDHNLKLAKQTKYPKCKGPGGKPKGGVKLRSPERRQLMTRSGPGRELHPQKEDPQSKQMPGFEKEKHKHWCEDHQHGWYTLQHHAHFALPGRSPRQIKPWL